MTIREKQLLLSYLGFYTGELDGLWGSQSEAATKSFQEQWHHGLSIDGVCGRETEKALKQAVAEDFKKEKESGSEAEKSGTFWDEIEFFDRIEFKCTCKGKYCNGFPVEPDPKIVKVVDQIRRHFGKPFTPNSAIRCTKRNAEVGGVKNSQHLYGTACDLSVPGVAPSEVAAYAETLMPDWGGIGIYSWGVHVDSRPSRARWRG